MIFSLRNCALIVIIILSSCNTGNLKVISDLPSNLPEISAIEHFPNSDIFWVIEDAGNKNILYGIDFEGKVVREVTITNAENVDWEDLTTDNKNTLYIGDFGNNRKKRKVFTIYKISNINKINHEAKAESISFTLPKKIKSKDFESFFLFNGYFYLFTKENKHAVLLKIPNKTGTHVATFVTAFEITGKRSKVTSADINPEGTSIVLLNHDKAWQFSNFKGDDFFKGDKKRLDFDHNSQKEGICFYKKDQLLITDERQGSDGGNLYNYELD